MNELFEKHFRRNEVFPSDWMSQLMAACTFLFSRFFTYSFLARVQDTEAAHRPPQEYSPPRHQRPHLLSEKSSVLPPYLENKKCSPFFVVSDWG